MKKILAAMLFVCVLLICTAALAADFTDDSVIVMLKDTPSDTASLYSESMQFGGLETENIECLDMMPENGDALLMSDDDMQTYKLTLAEKGHDEVLDAVEYLNTLENVEYAGPNYIYRVSYVPNDTYYANQYYLRKVYATALWNMNIDCSSVTVAVLDSGIALSHPDLADNIWTNPNEKAKTGLFGRDNDKNGYRNDLHGWDFIDSDNDPSDENGHGTHVAGIISASTGNGIGIASAARNAKLVPLRVMDSKGEGTTDNIYRAVRYASNMGFDIINCSFGGDGFDAAVQSAIKKANILFVCAAGNNSSDNDTSPAYPASINSSNVIAVASTDSADNLSSFSNYGANSVDIAAPGTNILSTYYDLSNPYVYMSGTSMACPLVTSVAAVIKAKYPSMTPAQIIEKLTSSADSVSTLNGKVHGGRRLNAYQALAVHAESVSLSRSEITLKVGETAQLAVSVLPSDVTDMPMWTTYEGSVAYFEDGIITARGEGIAEVEVSYGNVRASCTVTVIAADSEEGENTANTYPVSQNEAGEIVFSENGGSLQASLQFGTVKPLGIDDVVVYATYRSKAGELERISQLNINDEYTADIPIPEGFEDCAVTVYAWNKNMRPFMKAQTYR